jgi:hypothetical protein
MTQRHGLGLLGMALLLGVLGDGLLRSAPWGINFPLWLAVAIAGGWAVLPDGTDRPRISGWPLLAALFFAVCIAWRDAEFLRFWNAVAVMGLLSLPIVEMRSRSLKTTAITGYLLGIADAGAGILRGAFAPLPAATAWGHFVRYRGNVGAGAIGVALSLPILIVFGSLLVFADAGFANLVHRVVRVNTEVAASHIALAGVVTWICAGYICALMRRREDRDVADAEPVPTHPVLGVVEIGIPLGALAALFATFLGVQANYFFGGEEAMSRAGLIYSEYARQGFIELTFASALLLPLLLGADWVFSPGQARHRVWFRRLVACLLVLTAALMGSALHRVALYVNEYGWTEIRLYATAFIIWLGTVHLAFATTVLRGHRHRFVFRAMATGLAVLGTLNVLNPEAVIVRSQLDRYAHSGQIDAEYLVRLSADAIPPLVQAMPILPTGARAAIEQARQTRWQRIEGKDWRSWNVSRANAHDALRGTHAVIQSGARTERSPSRPE